MNVNDYDPEDNESSESSNADPEIDSIIDRAVRVRGRDLPAPWSDLPVRSHVGRALREIQRSPSFQKFIGDNTAEMVKLQVEEEARGAKEVIRIVGRDKRHDLWVRQFEREAYQMARLEQATSRGLRGVSSEFFKNRLLRRASELADAMVEDRQEDE